MQLATHKTTPAISHGLMSKLGTLAASAGLALLLSGCATIYNATKFNPEVLGGKVFRAKVTAVHGYVSSKGYERSYSGKKFYGESQFMIKAWGGPAAPADIVPYRVLSASPNGAWEGSGVFNNGPIGNAASFVDDSVPLLKDGDWVDVYLHEPVGGDLSVKEHRYATVVRLVCMSEDKACMKREKAAGRVPGRVVQSKGQFDPRQIHVSPHMDLSGNWLPGMEPVRPEIPAANI